MKSIEQISKRIDATMEVLQNLDMLKNLTNNEKDMIKILLKDLCITSICESTSTINNSLIELRGKIKSLK